MNQFNLILLMNLKDLKYRVCILEHTNEVGRESVIFFPILSEVTKSWIVKR